MRRLTHVLLPLALTVACRSVQMPSSGAAVSATPATTQPVARAVALTAEETRIRNAVDTHYDSAITLLQRAVDIPSGTHNLTGVRKVGDLFAADLRSLGFETQWVSMPDSLHRAGHLLAVHRGTKGPRLLLIGHLDTVFEGEGQGWVRADTIARGAGTSDMKGGDVSMLLALRALADAGTLRDMQITVVMSGDEESAGHPLTVARATLIDAAHQSDIALAFEGGSATRVAIGRRGSSNWRLAVTAHQAHSAGVFSPSAGYGASYEAVRVLDEFRRTMAGEDGLTFNIGIMGGGAHVTVDSSGSGLTVDGKSNIIPPVFFASGDLRFLTEQQKDSARTRMRAIVAHPLAGTNGTITFEDSYPAMAVTPAGEKLLSLFDATSRSLGYPSVSTTRPEDRGAGDISFIAPYIPGMDGLGVNGAGAHSPRELVYLPSIRLSAERAAVFMSRLLTEWPRGAAHATP